MVPEGKPADANETASVVIEEMVHRAAGGDRAALTALLERYRYFIRRSIQARLGPSLRARESTSDLEQDVAIEVLESLAHQKWQGRRAFLAWLRRLATAEVIDAARYHHAARRRCSAETSLDGGERAGATRSPESWLDEQRRLADLERSLDALPTRHAQALVLHYQGHSHAEIGEILGCTPEAARKCVARARATLASSRKKSETKGPGESGP